LPDEPDIAKVIVSKWGGVRRNKDTTFEGYVKEILKPIPSTPLGGIASYSKIFAIADMNKYAIYDARVAACLNAIQWNSDMKNGIAFNYIDGRNKVTGHKGEKKGFAHQNEFETKYLIEHGWKKVEKDETYTVYLELLKECLKHFKDYKLHDLEMVLFANAEKECKKAMDSLCNS